MKKLLSVLTAVALLLSLAPFAVSVDDAVGVYLNGEKLEKEGIIISDRTYLPVRALCEALGYTVSWENDARSVIIGSAPEKSKNPIPSAFILTA